MVYRKTKYNCHDGQLEEYQIGPRNELRLYILLDPVWNPDGPERCTIRFGKIRNMHEVRSFFSHIPDKPKHGDFLDEILGIVYKYKSIWLLDLAGAGGLLIESPQFSEL